MSKTKKTETLDPHSLAGSTIFDYRNSSYIDFCNYLENMMKDLMSQATNGLVAKNLIIYGMGINNFPSWRHILVQNSVIDGEKKLWAMNYIMALQEQHWINTVQREDLLQHIRQSMINMMPLYWGNTYRDELSQSDGKKLEAFKEKFTIELKGSGKLND